MAVGVRYIVNDIDAAMEFYRDQLAFAVDMHMPGAFAMLSRDGVKLFLNRPGAGGAGQPDKNGAMPAPGGWNRMQIDCADLDATVATLKAAGAPFRTDVIQGNGGRQILVEDPSRNLIELFEPRS